MAAYAHPEVLVETDWLASHLNDPKVRVAEVDYDPAANYEMGHLPGSVLFDWRKDINDPVARDILSGDALTALFARAGINEDTSLVLYGDFNNWFAAFAFWVFSYYGAKNLKLMNGGRKKWIAQDRPLTKEVPKPAAGHFKAHPPEAHLRSFLEDVRKALPEVKGGTFSLVDVRGPKEFSGEIDRASRVPDRTRPARRTHPRREEHPLGASGQGGRHVQVSGGARRALPVEGRPRERPRDRLLPDRRALEPHLVRSEVPARVPRRPQLRRFLDRVGKPDPDPDREVSRRDPPANRDGDGALAPLPFGRGSGGGCVPCGGRARGGRSGRTSGPSRSDSSGRPSRGGSPRPRGARRSPR